MATETVHVFLSHKSERDVRAYVFPTYTPDGVMIPSRFMHDVGLRGWSPTCVEIIVSPEPRPIAQLLRGASYAEQWLPQVRDDGGGEIAICVYSPNVLDRPKRAAFEFVGAFGYDPS